MFWNQYPYINLNDLNLDYLLNKLKELEQKLSDFVKINTIKYADPIQWNITRQYEANTVVIDGTTGTAYLSTKPVPSGVTLTNTDYWAVIFTLDLLSANDNITFRDDGANIIATFTSAENDWLMWNEKLYKVIKPIAINEAYVPGYNINRYSVELFIKEYLNLINNRIDELINSKYYTTPEEFGAVGDGTTDDSQAINDAIADGRPVMFDGDKTYKCNSYLTINSGTYLAGNGCTITFDTNSTLDANHNFMIGDTIKDVIIKDFIFKFNTPANLSVGLAFYDSENILIENCYFYEAFGVSFQANVCKNLKVVECSFIDVTGALGSPGEGMYLRHDTDVIIDKCSCDALDDHFVYITDLCSNVRITNCIAKKCGQGSVAPGAAYQIYANSNNIVLDNCSDIDCAKGAILIIDQSPYSGIGYDILVSNHYSRNCTGNWFTASGSASLPIYRVIIKNCNINCNGNAIRIDNTHDIIVEGNLITTQGVGGFNHIDLTNTTKAIIKGNILKGANNVAILLGRSGTNACAQIEICNNIFDGLVNAGVHAQNVTDSAKLMMNVMMGSADVYMGMATVLGDAKTESNRHSITFGNNSEPIAHYTGDIIFNKTPASGQPIAWICTNGNGTGIGTLVSIGNLP